MQGHLQLLCPDLSRNRRLALLQLSCPEKLHRGTLITARVMQNIDSVELKDSRANALSTQRQRRQAGSLFCLETSVTPIRVWLWTVPLQSMRARGVKRIRPGVSSGSSRTFSLDAVTCGGFLRAPSLSKA